MPVSTVAQSDTSFAGRLIIAFTELTLAAAVIVGAVVVGHELREWRDWYPIAHHPWLDDRPPTTEVPEP